MLKNGIPAKIASERLGHSSVGITLDLYSHVINDMQKDASEIMHKNIYRQNTIYQYLNFIETFPLTFMLNTKNRLVCPSSCLSASLWNLRISPVSSFVTVT